MRADSMQAVPSLWSRIRGFYQSPDRLHSDDRPTSRTKNLQTLMSFLAPAILIACLAPSASAQSITAVTVNPTVATGGTSVLGTVTLDSPAPGGGAVVTLSGNNDAAGLVDPSVTVPPGATSANFSVLTNTVTNISAVTVTGTYNGSQATTLIVNPAGVVATSVWTPDVTPTTADNGPSTPIEVGVRFNSDSDGYVLGVLFYKGLLNTGTHVGNLWTTGGQLLATATFTGETASGWQQVIFSNPVHITTNTDYIASYHSSTGDYSLDTNWFTLGTPTDSVPLHLPGDGSGGFNGVFANGVVSTFPNASFQASNYWVDVLFDVTPTTLSISTQLMPDGYQGGFYFETLSAAGGTQPYSWSLVSGSLPPGLSLTSNGILDGTPTVPQTYNFTLQVTDSGTVPQTVSQLFGLTIAPAGGCPCTIWTPDAVPGMPDNGATTPIELGMRFQADSDGFITAIQFYKGGTQNPGPHTVNLWTSGGQLLATATSTAETPSGWQLVTLTPSVHITANTPYIASYHSTGDYAVDPFWFAFATPTDNAPLHAPGDTPSAPNGVFANGATSTFPNTSLQATNYWVDITYDPVPGPSIASLTINPSSAKVTTTGTVTLSDVAPPGGEVVNLSSSYSPLVTVPATVTVPQGTTSTTFQLTLAPAPTAIAVTITAIGNGIQTADVTVLPPSLTAVSLNPTAVPGSQANSTGTVTLDSPASVLGVTVALSSDNTAAATVPASVTIPSGATSTTFPVTTNAVVSTTQVTISATVDVTQTAVLTVNPPVVLVSIAVTPGNPTIFAGGTQQFTATGTYSDSSTQNLTNSATWASTNTAAATIASGGLATGIATGGTTIRATSGLISGSTGLTVTAPVLVSIAVTPANPAIVTGATQQFTATGTYSDASTQNLTFSVAWTSTNTAAATISGSGLATGVAGGNTTIQATSGAITGSTGLSVTASALVSIAVTPSNATILTGGIQQFTAIGTYSNGSTQNLTNFVTWVSTTTATATVTGTGVVSGVAAGTTTIQATSGSITGSANLAAAATISGLVGHWTFNDGSGTNAADSSGNNHPVTLFSGISWTGGADGKIGGAISANGVNQYGSIPAIDLSGTSAVTVSLWVNRTYSTAGGHILLEATTNYNASATGFGLFPDDSTCNGIQASVHGNGGYTANCYSQPSSGVWHHLVVVYDKTQTGSNEVNLYIDDVLQTPTLNYVISNNTNAFGNNPIYLFSRGGTGAFDAGKMDDLQIYSRALSASEIEQLPNLASVSLNPSSVVGGVNESTGTVTFDGPAPLGGASVALSSNNPAAGAVPASVNVAPGATTATFTVSTSAVALTSTATISATYGGATKTGNLTVTPFVVAGIGHNVQFAAGDSGAASSSTTHLGLTSTSGNLILVFTHWDNQAITVTSVTDGFFNTYVPISGPINIGAADRFQAWYAKNITAGAPVSVTVTYSGTTASISLVDVAEYTGLDTSAPLDVFASAIGNGTSQDTGFAPATTAKNETIIGLFGYDNNATPFTAGPGFINEQYDATSFVEDKSVNTTGSYNATAISSGSTNWMGYVVGFKDAFQSTLSLTLNPQAVTGGNSSTGTITLRNAAPGGGATVTLSSDNPLVAAVPPSVNVAAGTTTATFTVNTNAVNASIPVNITGTYNGGSYTATQWVNSPGPALSALAVNPTTVTGGNTSTGTVTLNAVAPAGGATVALSSSNPAVATVLANVTVAAGSTTATFTVNTTSVSVAAPITIVATYNGVTLPASLTVEPVMAQLAIDTFTRPNNPTLGPNWTPLVGAGTNVPFQTVNNSTGQIEAASASPNIAKEMYYGGLNWTPNQYSQVQIVAASGGGNEGPAVRMSSNDTHYACIVSSVGAGNASVAIILDNAGTYTTLASSLTSTVIAGNTVRCMVQGTNLIMTDQTTSTILLTATDATIPAGYPGLVASAGNVANYVMSTWTGGTSEPPLALQQIASDSFNRADALNLGANWSVGTGHGPIQIVSHQAQPYPAGGTQPSKEHYVAAGAFPSDQWARVQVVVQDQIGDMGLELRASNTSDTMYVPDVNITGPAGMNTPADKPRAITRIVKVVNGAITGLVADTEWSSVAPGDFVRGQVQGKLISLIDETTGALLVTTIDTDVTSGYPGLSMAVINGTPADHIAANWSGGKFQ